MATLSRAQQRLKRIEEQVGVKQERYILLIGFANPDAKCPEWLGEEILPNVSALVYGGGGPLTIEEIEALRTKWISRDEKA